MRRVFPLRPAETSLLVTYSNGTFEHEVADPPSSSSSSSSAIALNLNHRRRSSTGFSVDGKSLPSSPRKLPLQKFASSADYPEFAEVTSPSSLRTSSFIDDGDSTSFNSSDDTHRRPGSYFSSSSSSSINFNPGDAGSSLAISSSKDVDALLDTASSSITHHTDARNATWKDLKVHMHVKTHSVDVEVPIPKTSLKALAIATRQDLVQPETPTYVIPKRVEEYIQDCLGMPSHRSTSTPKACDRSHESPENHVCRSRPAVSSSRWCVPSKPPLQRKDTESCSCSTPFKYFTKCLRSGKGKTAKVGHGRQPSLPAKFSTLTNGLYSPQLSPRCRLPSDVERARQIDSFREDARGKSNRNDDFIAKDASATTPELVTESKMSDDKSISEQNWQSMKCESFGSAMVNDYVRHLKKEAKSASSHKSCRSASFHYDTDLGLSRASKPQSGSREAIKKSVIFQQGLDGRFSQVSAQRLDPSLTKVSGQRPYSMDVSARLGRDGSICSSKADSNNSHLDYSLSSDLFVAKEKNSQILALLRLEINKLCKEKRFLARELAAEMKARHCEQETVENVIRHMEAEMEEKLISVERDHAYAQVCLEQEMDRRRKEWSAKLDKIRLEEKRLRDRVTEMALERVELQKAIGLYKGREASLQASAKGHELSAQTWMRRHLQSEEEVLLLRKSFTDACNKLGDKEHELDLVLQTSKALERENVELCNEISRLRKAHAGQELTFEELWQRLVDIVNGPSDSKLERLRRLHGELKVFALKELALRYEIDLLQTQLLQSKQRTHTSEDGSHAFSSTRMCSPKEYLRCSKNSTGKSLETVEDLINKLELTKQHQLEVKEEEVELLHSALDEREIVVNDLQGELTSVKAQRDGLRKQVQQMSQEAIRLTRDLTELRQVVEKLDDELMLKEGEISILRDTCSDSDF